MTRDGPDKSGLREPLSGHQTSKARRGTVEEPMRIRTGRDWLGDVTSRKSCRAGDTHRSGGTIYTSGLSQTTVAPSL